MPLLDLEIEIKREVRNSGAWADQIGNIFYALFWGLGTWLSTSTVMLGLVISFLVASGELSAAYSSYELINAFTSIMLGVYVIGAFVTLLFGLPKKIRNVFLDIAQDRVNRQKDLYKQADLVESILIRHCLITEIAAKQAKDQRELQ